MGISSHELVRGGALGCDRRYQVMTEPCKHGEGPGVPTRGGANWYGKAADKSRRELAECDAGRLEVARHWKTLPLRPGGACRNHLLRKCELWQSEMGPRATAGGFC
jgi:hypothetical protein